MNVIVIGLGSMGKRRISLLNEFEGISISGIDSNAARRTETSEKFGISTYESIKDAVASEKPDSAFVCTSPIHHGEIINECLKCDLNVFTEINLVSDRYEENIRLAKEKGKVLFLSSTFLYRFENREIIKKVSEYNEKFNYLFHVGQYLPDWHPWENFKDFFVGDKRTNGCRELFAIELPWVVTCFGEIDSVSVMKDNITSLGLGYSDNYMVQIKHKNGNKGVFAVDVASRRPTRRIEVMSENVYMTWNGTPDTLYDYDISAKKDVKITPETKQDHRSEYAEMITEIPYKEEINAFIKCVNGDKEAMKWDFEKDLAVLDVIDKIEGLK